MPAQRSAGGRRHGAEVLADDDGRRSMRFEARDGEQALLEQAIKARKEVIHLFLWCNEELI